MPDLEPVKFRVSKDVIEIGTSGLSGSDARNRGAIVAQSVRKVPDVVGELCRRLPLSRTTIVRILRECDRLDQVVANPAIFIDEVANAISKALYNQLTEGIVYSPSGAGWSADLFRERHQEETVAPRIVAVEHSVTDYVVCDSEVEERFARYLDQRHDVPLFIKLPDWFKIPTPPGNYNPDWAFVRKESGAQFLYLVRETKGGSDIEKLRFEAEGWKIKFGDAHFRSLHVDYAFGHDVEVLIEPTYGTSWSHE